MLDDRAREKLLSYYNDQSKHANYQNFPEFVTKAVGINSTIDENWRGDTARFAYLCRTLDFGSIATLGDVGANTGRFCLDLAHLHPGTCFTAIEPNQSHAGFMALVKESFGLANIDILAEPATLSNLGAVGRYDVVLLMNVLHHAGVDFDKGQVAGAAELKAYVVKYLSAFRQNAKMLVFQLGYNWGGNKQAPVVSPQDPAGMLDYVDEVCALAGWKVRHIALYSAADKQYHNAENPKDIVTAGAFMANSEFYKRPMYILEQV